jgi:hypothetical protein
MPRYHYGTVPALAWLLNHYFYGGLHYSWLAEEFAPLLTNPKSSNPYLIYGDLYSAWVWEDEHDKFVDQSRISLEGGVDAREEAGRVDPALAERLRRICQEVHVEFFYPLVYRVDVGRISPERVVTAGSGLRGSRECLIKDLQEPEFDILFSENVATPALRRLVLDERSGDARTSPVEALRTLEGRLVQ